MTELLESYYSTATQVSEENYQSVVPLGLKSIQTIIEGLEANEHLIRELDTLTKGNTDPKLYSALKSLKESLANRLDNIDKERTTPSDISEAFQDFPRNFIASSIFMPKDKWVDHMRHFRHNDEIRTRVQLKLLEISTIRRTLWRTFEHLTKLIKTPASLGIIDMSTNIQEAVSHAIELERSKLPQEYSGRTVIVPERNDVTIPTDLPRFISTLREIIRNGVFSTIKRDGNGNIIRSQKAQVKIDLNTNNQEVDIAITDNGIGITKDQPVFMTQYGYTDSTRGASFGGRGVGLSISKLTTQEHGGELHITPKEHGTEIKIKLPKSTFKK